MAGPGRLASVSECSELDFPAYSDVDSVRPFSRYLDAIRCISASRSGWSGCSRSSSSPSACTSSDHSPFAVDLLFEAETAAVDDKVLGDPGLREIAAQMVRDRHIHGLVMAFDREPGVLGRWFSELDVDWVVAGKDNGSFPDGSPDQWSVRRWTHALAVMVQALGGAQRYLRREWPTTAGGGIEDIEDALMKLSATDEPADGLLLARFSQASISTMLGFADALASAKNDVRAMEKIWALLEVYTCVWDAAETLMPPLQAESRLLRNEDMKSLVREMEDVFSRSMHKMRQAIWTMIRDVKALITSKESWGAIPGNGQVHYTTRLVAEHLKLFWRYRSALNPIIVLKQLSDSWDSNLSCGTAIFGRRTIYSTDQAIAYMIHQLQCQLEAAESRSFSDPSLRYLFLANNSDFVMQPFVDSFSDFPVRIISNEMSKIDGYLESYVSVSWEPVVSCLHDQFQTMLCFSKQPSLTTFMCELQRIYNAHKLRRIPNLHLRVRLRKAIIGKVIGAYEGYLADQYDVQDRYLGHDSGRGPPLPPRSSTSVMLDMLNELFEG
ncbi:unnamed protein product [Urochloa decumbens]|uniref:Exocyst subunit Exo70 family protein n=1 Tax=Urochloa decumbens TaxID=240449 RepID=A0ABC9GH73_9POAL